MDVIEMRMLCQHIKQTHFLCVLVFMCHSLGIAASEGKNPLLLVSHTLHMRCHPPTRPAGKTGAISIVIESVALTQTARVCAMLANQFMPCRISYGICYFFVTAMSWHPFLLRIHAIQTKTYAQFRPPHSRRIPIVRNQLYMCVSLNNRHARSEHRSQMSFYLNNNACEMYTHNWYYCSITHSFCFVFTAGILLVWCGCRCRQCICFVCRGEWLFASVSLSWAVCRCRVIVVVVVVMLAFCIHCIVSNQRVRAPPRQTHQTCVVHCAMANAYAYNNFG